MNVMAPFNSEQIYSLLQWQFRGEIHPYTCPNEDHENQRVLVPRVGGLICPACHYRQNWVYEVSTTKYPRETPLPVHEQPTEFRYSALPPDHPESMHFEVTVNYRGQGLWAVIHGTRCWSRENERFEYERLPSGRAEEWLTDHRFLLEEAQQLARRIAPKVSCNGWTVDAVLARENGGLDG